MALPLESTVLWEKKWRKQAQICWLIAAPPTRQCGLLLEEGSREKWHVDHGAATALAKQTASTVKDAFHCSIFVRTIHIGQLFCAATQTTECIAYRWVHAFDDYRWFAVRDKCVQCARDTTNENCSLRQRVGNKISAFIDLCVTNKKSAHERMVERRWLYMC